jgi:glycosyltransferase involved in cell wall biosynthesis
MASHNGSQFIRQQISSILEQTAAVDEIIIVDDASTDNTVEILNSFHDARIVLIQNQTNIGVVRSFEKSMMRATGGLIFLCDQDDIWRSDKVERFMQYFASHLEATLLVSDAKVIDKDGKTIRDSWLGHPRSMPSLFANLVRNRYTGCLLALRKSALVYCLPIPPQVPMHDAWIGMLCQIYGQVGYIAEPLTSYRRHGKNVTAEMHAAFFQMIVWRFWLVSELVKRLYKTRSSSAQRPRL